MTNSSNQGGESRTMREIIRDLLDTQPSLSQQKIAKEIGTGVSGTTLSQWLGGSYQGDNAKIESRVRSWYDTYLERAARSGLPEAPEFFETTTTEAIEAGLRYAQLAQDMVAIYGPAGVSKSQTCANYCRIAPGVYMATMTPATCSVLSSLQVIATACGVRELATTPKKLQDAIVSRLLGSNGCLIIDEAQHLSPNALDQVRGLHDAALVGIALVGNEYVYSRMKDGARAAFLDRVFSRIGKTVEVRRPNDSDIDALLGAWRVSDTNIRATIREIARRPGALRSATKTLRLASSFAHAEERALAFGDVQAAVRDLRALS